MNIKKFHTSNLHKWIEVLLSPFTISFLASLFLIILFFPSINKYEISITESQKSGSNVGVFEDFNGDGISDRANLYQDTSQNFQY